jgi:hypothetical protein
MFYSAWLSSNNLLKKNMQKTIFTIILLTSLFAVTGLTLAQNISPDSPLEEIWAAIDDLQAQFAGLKTASETANGQEKIFSDKSITVIQEKTAEKMNKKIPQSEHYAINGLMFQ